MVVRDLPVTANVGTRDRQVGARQAQPRYGDHLSDQAWLATPPGNGPFPAVIETHGGPEGVTTDQFLPMGQI